MYKWVGDGGGGGGGGGDKGDYYEATGPGAEGLFPGRSPCLSCLTWQHWGQILLGYTPDPTPV